jgi:hypothetical protein
MPAAQRYDLSTAQLQTSLAHPDLHATFSDSSGRQFVAADDEGLRKAAALLVPNTEQHTWLIDYAALGRHAGAYPGTMPVYADVPTVGIDAATAQHLATFLRYAATDGEQAGTANGQLPPGYLPLTAANGLHDLADYTRRAAAAVAAQQGQIPSLDAPPSGAPAPSPSPPVGPGATPPPGGGPAVVPPVGGGDISTPSTPSTDPSGSGSSATDAPGTIGVRAAASYSRLGSLTLPLALLLAALCGVVGSVLRYPDRTRAALVRVRGLTRMRWRR